MKYKVWLSIDQAFEVEAPNKERAREMVQEEGFDNKIIEERNWEFIETEEINQFN